LGKHVTIGQIIDRFSWLFAEVRLSEFFVFAVLRDPVDFMLSMYNSHRDPSFATDPRLYTGNQSFTQFLQRWVPANADQVRPQYERLLDHQGHIGVDYVISYENLAKGLETVGHMIGISPIGSLHVQNKSFGRLRRADLHKAEQEWIYKTYIEDMIFRKQFCDGLLDSADKARWLTHCALSPRLAG
jgi:hypothetical protein